MSYDLIVFDPAAAPRERSPFVDWIKHILDAHDGPLAGDAAGLSPALQAWRRDMGEFFPGARDPHAFDPDSVNASKNAEYRCAPHVIAASFAWEACGPAQFRVKKLAQTHRLGLFDASGDEAAVWMVSDRGRFEVVHSRDGDLHSKLRA